ncbi:MAG: VCBS repeat-containing protein [Burkholderiales bacterium]|nr:VCBS repeat-containing protein [Burkholderiales bacterium]
MKSIRPARAAAAAALALVLAACGGGGGGGRTIELPPFWISTDVQVADLDGDGRPDIVTIGQYATPTTRSGYVQVRLQTAPGVFSPPRSYPAGGYPWRLQIADVDGDGAPDLVVSDVDPTPFVTTGAVLLLKQATVRGTFLPAQSLVTTDNKPYDLAVGDVNGDGKPDIVVAADVAGTVGATLLAQDPVHAGSFLAPLALPLPGAATHVALGDLDGDGRNDLVFRVVRSATQGVADSGLGVLAGRPDGSLGAWTALPSDAIGLNGERLAVVDADGDGRRDVLEFLSACCTDYQSQARRLLQTAPGTFARTDTLLGAYRPLAGAFSDLNGDGRTDLALASTTQDGTSSTRQAHVYTLFQDPSGLFQPAQAIDMMPMEAYRVAAADLNGDGLPDLVVVGTDNRVFVLYQSAAAPGTYPTVLALD